LFVGAVTGGLVKEIGCVLWMVELVCGTVVVAVVELVPSVDWGGEDVEAGAATTA